ncbi:transcriptional regulator [Microbacterium sp. Root61]|uniref:winged helix-turn-helix transcriptional regulator n=1 Tax=Microbacterium sp. Root61 TaxID=1736570 RepID=UPI0006F35C7D|nr:helix-turn-helix domain-containing protein [Microbacterium sp. Root61]KRA24422.1 transcriptional regulator [Microbacterium sp. Root61]
MSLSSVVESEGQGALSEYENTCAAAESQGRTIRDLLSRIGDKWTLLVIVTLDKGRLRFTELQRHIPGVSQRMLTLTLRHLERDGLLTRTVHAEVPPRVEYELTDTGRTLIAPSVALAQWAIANRRSIESSRAAFDDAHSA